MQAVQLFAENSLALDETRIELDSHVDKSVVGNHCLVIHDHNRPVNVLGYNPKVGLKHAHIVHVTIACTKPERDHVVMLLINHAIEMKGLDHHLLCPMPCCMNGVVINEVPKFSAPIASETTHAIEFESPVDATHQNIIQLKLNGLTSYFKVISTNLRRA